MEGRELWEVRALFSASQQKEINLLFVFLKGPRLLVHQLFKISRQPRKSQTLQLLPKEFSMSLSHDFSSKTFQQVSSLRSSVDSALCMVPFGRVQPAVVIHSIRTHFRSSCVALVVPVSPNQLLIFWCHNLVSHLTFNFIIFSNTVSIDTFRLWKTFYLCYTQQLQPKARRNAVGQLIPTTGSG